MKLHEILLLDYQTKEGKQITLSYHKNTEQAVAPWVIHQINASIGRSPAGYIKISYIPKNNLKKYLPTIFNYLQVIKGQIMFPSEKKYSHYNTLTDEKLVDSFAATHNYTIGNYPEYDSNTRQYLYQGKFVSDYTRNQLLDIYKSFEQKLLKQYKTKYANFKKFHVDAPLVDFIRSHIPRQRIGVALYLAGTEWINDMGMNLYASGLQTDEAKYVWEYLAKHYDVRTDKRGTYIKL